MGISHTSEEAVSGFLAQPREQGGRSDPQLLGKFHLFLGSLFSRPISVPEKTDSVDIEETVSNKSIISGNTSSYRNREHHR